MAHWYFNTGMFCYNNWLQHHIVHTTKSTMVECYVDCELTIVTSSYTTDREYRRE